MADFNRDGAQQYQDEKITKVVDIYHTLGREVIDYYTNHGRIETDEDASRNLFEMRKWIRLVRDELDRTVSDIDAQLGE